jgi:hypothetical protein
MVKSYIHIVQHPAVVVIAKQKHFSLNQKLANGRNLQVNMYRTSTKIILK